MNASDWYHATGKIPTTLQRKSWNHKINLEDKKGLGCQKKCDFSPWGTVYLYRPRQATWASFYVCFLCYLEGGVLLSGLWGNDKSLVRWRWKPVGQTASKCGLHESPAYLERTGTLVKNQTGLFWLNFSCASTQGVSWYVCVSNEKHPFLTPRDFIEIFR